MAYNKVFLAGTVMSEPEFTMDGERGDTLHIKIHINRNDIGKSEVVTVAIFNDELMSKALDEIKEGDYIMITNAKIVTTNYNKVSPVVCPICQNVEYKQTKAEKTEVEVFSYQLMKNIKKEEAIGINKVYLLGDVCSQLNYRPGANNGKDYVKYKLAVNRPNNKPKSEKNADYPFVVSFNNEATTAHEHLKLSSRVFVDGAIQERDIVQKVPFDCSACHNKEVSKVKSVVREVITAKVEYLNVKKEEKSEKESEE